MASVLKIVRIVLRHHKTALYVVFLLTLLLVGSTRGWGAQYEYRGVYDLQTLVVQYCEDCYLELPPDLLKTEVVLSVSTDSDKGFFKSLQAAARSQGWELTREGKKLAARPVQNDGNAVYISCMDHQPKNVPQYLYRAALKSDSLLCAERDSLADLAAQRADSSARVADSLANIPPLDFRNYELRYYSYSKSFTDKVGMEWGSIIAEGNLHNKFRIYDAWKIHAAETNDTTFNYRAMFFSVDSLMNVDWGSEEQVLEKSYNDGGVITTDYEWRKYGLIVTIQRAGKRVRVDYTFRDKDNSVSVLQGSVTGLDGDTLFLQGNYIANRLVQTGLPVLSRLPILGYLFSTETTISDLKEFELYLIPQERTINESLSMRSIERVKPIYKVGKYEKDSGVDSGVVGGLDGTDDKETDIGGN